jgi:copper transport protein
MRRTLVAAAAVIVLWALVVSPASAHALLTAADPAPNSVLAAAPATVTLTFTEAPDPKLSSVRVLDSAGVSHAKGSAATVSGQPDELNVAVEPLPDGVYTVAWRTVSAEDGHIADGAYAFSVGTTTPPAGVSEISSTSLGEAAGASTGVIVARWILYLGLLGLLGAAFLGSILLRGRETKMPLRLAIGELAVALVGSVSLVAFQIGDTGASLGDVVGSSLGRDAVMRLAPLVLAAGLLGAATAASWRPRRVLLAATGSLAALDLFVEALLSHAASQAFAPAEIAVQWFHLTSVGLWLGGLLALLSQLRGPATPEKSELARRFAGLAGFGLALVALTGLLRSIADTGTLDALVSTDFGRLVLLKIGLMLPIAALGAINHFYSVPRSGRGLSALRRAGSTELALGAVVLLVASLLVTIAPPTEVSAADADQSSPKAASATPAPLSVTGSDYATTIRLRLTVSLGAVGSNGFGVRVIDFDTGAPVQVTAVRLTFTLPARPDIGSSTLDLRAQSDGTFTGTGANLSIGGTWRVSALVTELTTSAEVDLTVSVGATPTQIDVNSVPGSPTLYTIHLGGGRTVTIYLDPGTPGPNLLHATWFDAKGDEMPVSNVVMTELAASGGSTALQPLIVDPGHEAASVQVASLPVTFDISAVGPDGSFQTVLEIGSNP